MKIHDKPSGQWMGKADVQEEAMVEEIEENEIKQASSESMTETA